MTLGTFLLPWRASALRPLVWVGLLASLLLPAVLAADECPYPDHLVLGTAESTLEGSDIHRACATITLEDGYTVGPSAQVWLETTEKVVFRAGVRAERGGRLTVRVGDMSRIETHAVTTSVGSGGSIQPSSLMVPDGASAEFTITAGTGYSIDTVAGCEGSLAADRYLIHAVTEPCTVSATFAANRYTLTYAAGPGGWVIGDTPQTVNHGGSGTAVAAAPHTGYWFQKWSDDSTANPRTDTNVTGDVSVTAEFLLISYTVTASAGAGGTISPTSQTVQHGGTTSFAVISDEGYGIDHVSGCNGSLLGNIYTTGVIAAPCTVSATFRQKHTVATNAGVGGSINPESQLVDHGSTAWFNVVSEPGYGIGSVTGCGATLEYGSTYVSAPITASCTITVSFLPGYPFSQPTTFFANNPYYLEIFDLNDDGYREILNPATVGTQWTGYSGVLEVFQFGSVENPFANAMALDIGDSSFYVSVFDLVGNDDKGLFVASRAGCSVDYYVMDENFDLTFTSRFSTGSCGDRFVLGVDLNDDGLVDAISNSGSISLGLENSEFMRHHDLLGIWSGSGLEVADVNNNGILDVVAYDGHETVAVFLGNGDATFQPGQPYSLQDEELQCSCSHCGVVMVGDVNGNHIPDIVVANNCMVYSLMGNGDGTFGELRPALGRAGGIYSVAAGDLNSNGYLDLVVSESNVPDAVRVYRGFGDGTFGLPFGVDVGLSEVSRVYVADVDGDGPLDIISAGGYNNAISVTLGE